MRLRTGLGLLAVVLLAGCSETQCPKPVAYSDATLKQIEKAREALPRDNILQQVLIDYENERDDLRHCQ